MALHSVRILLAVFVLLVDVRASKTNNSRPNVVLIVADDLGYGDVGCFGNTTLRTPHLDKLATQGVKLTHNIAAATMCTPSRAAFLTGRYPIRSGMSSPTFLRAIIFTASAAGLPASEITIGEVAKKAGYRTAFMGKWHLGWSLNRSDPNSPHPLNQGFDHFYGVPLTNFPDFGEPDINVLLKSFAQLPYMLMMSFLAMLFVLLKYAPPKVTFVCVNVFCILSVAVIFPLVHNKLLNSLVFRNYDLVEQPIHLPSMTRKLVKESENFLLACRADRAPFLLIVSWLHVHRALVTAPEFRGQSQHGPYGDAVEEMDWGVGQLMEMLDRFEMADNTLVYFTSDHGAAPEQRDGQGRTLGGSNRPFLGGKGDGSTEGSYRVPGLIRWPGQFPAGRVVTEPVSMMDVLPTLAEVILPPQHPDVTAAHVIDGKSLVALLKGEVTVSPHEFLFHYCGDKVHAVTYRPRTGHLIWKLKFREVNRNKSGLADKCRRALHLVPPELYELSSDPTASEPLSGADHAQVVWAIVEAVRQHQASVQEVPSQFTWWRLMWQPWKQPCCNFPYFVCEDKQFGRPFFQQDL